MHVSLFLFPSTISHAPSIVSLLCCMHIFFLNSYPKHEKYIYGIYTTIWSPVDNHHYCRTCWRWTRPPRELRTHTWRNTYISAIINPHKQYIYISLCPIWLISHPSYALALVVVKAPPPKVHQSAPTTFTSYFRPVWSTSTLWTSWHGDIASRLCLFPHVMSTVVARNAAAAVGSSSPLQPMDQRTSREHEYYISFFLSRPVAKSLIHSGLLLCAIRSTGYCTTAVCLQKLPSIEFYGTAGCYTQIQIATISWLLSVLWFLVVLYCNSVC